MWVVVSIKEVLLLLVDVDLVVTEMIQATMRDVVRNVIRYWDWGGPVERNQMNAGGEGKTWNNASRGGTVAGLREVGGCDSPMQQRKS